MVSERETRRAGVLGRVKVEELTQVEAAEIFGTELLAERAAVSTIPAVGVDGLVHGRIGKRSNHAKAARARRP
jgi:hypothetical protein